MMVLGGLTAALLAAAGTASGSLSQLHDYHVHIDERLSQLSVEACFDGRVPDLLYASHNWAGNVLEQAEMVVDGKTRRLRPDERQRLRIRQQPDDGCIRYQVDLGRAARSRNLGIAARAGEALVISPRIWLWQPRRLSPYQDIELHFELDGELQLSGPWRGLSEAGDDNPARFALGYPPLGWDASMVVGEFDQLQIERAGTRLGVAITSGPGEAADPTLSHDWLEAGLEAATTIYGRLPTDRVQAVIIPLDSGDRPLSSGRVSRAGGPGLLLGMKAGFPDSAYRPDPLMAHEFMHLLHPPVQREHAWLSEGIATYYQYIGLARAGHLSAESAWQRFLDDMDDGIWARIPGTILDITRAMGQEGGAEFVYWSGAALMLKADVALRSDPDTAESLDHVLAEWAACCFDARRSADGREALKELDRIAGTDDLFTAFYDDYILAVGFPDIAEILEQLGLPQPGKSFELDDEAPLAPLRRAIMTPHEAPLIDH
ncbi:hypothetical protein VCB98_08430 [Gammaproteobacteria bacterium AB-CW1]|uniref:Peptidase M61 catalytic domain-containing protein n=2 Tax=Natronospira TaxID=2024969 RepID=A0AAP6MME2_9GAMM|nr:hypothetical protein [Gammaproteobacteria bacterium AB-CW1]